MHSSAQKSTAPRTCHAEVVAGLLQGMDFPALPAVPPDPPTAVSLSGHPATAGWVLQLILSSQANSRSEIGRLTGLSRTAVTARVNQLMAQGLVVEDATTESNSGRPAGRLSFHASGGVVLAASIGRSRIQLAVADLECTLLAEESVEADPTSGPQHCVPGVGDPLH